MKNTHRISVRFDLADGEQRKVFEALHGIDRSVEKSISAFIIKAVGAYLDRLNSPSGCGFTLDEMRSAIREELSGIELASREPLRTAKPLSDMTEEERAENDKNVLAALDLFS